MLLLQLFWPQLLPFQPVPLPLQPLPQQHGATDGLLEPATRQQATYGGSTTTRNAIASGVTHQQVASIVVMGADANHVE